MLGPAIGAALLVVTGAGAAGASPALGQVVGTNPVNYTPNINQGAVYKSAEVNGLLYAGGSSTTVTAAAGTTPTVAANAGAVEVYRFAVDPAGTRLVGIGNVKTVGGQPRVPALMLTLGATSATVNAWRYRPLEVACSAPKIPDPAPAR